METMKFSLKRKSVDIVLENEQGKEEVYILREISGEEREKYLTSMASSMRFNEDGKPVGIDSFVGLHTSLLAMALVRQDGSPVTATFIKSFPASVQIALFKKAKELSGLVDSAKEEAKNV